MTTVATYNLKFIDSMVALKPAKLPLDIAAILSDISKRLPVSTVSTTTTATNTLRYAPKQRSGTTTTTSTYSTTPSLLTQQQKEDSATKVRLLLNKLTDKNYAEYSNIILRTLTLYDVTAEHAAEIFHIAVQNQFYVKIFAKLFAAILADIKLEPLFHTAFVNAMDSHIVALAAPFEYVPQSNYDGFCKMNAEIDRRKSTTNFLVHLVQLTGDKYVEYLIKIVTPIMELIISKLYDESIKNQMDELCEHVYMLCTNPVFVNNYRHEMVSFVGGEAGNPLTIIEFIGYLTTCSIKTQVGLTSKAKFKFKDAHDAIKLIL